MLNSKSQKSRGMFESTRASVSRDLRLTLIRRCLPHLLQSSTNENEMISQRSRFCKVLNTIGTGRQRRGFQPPWVKWMLLEKVYLTITMAYHLTILPRNHRSTTRLWNQMQMIWTILRNSLAPVRLDGSQSCRGNIFIRSLTSKSNTAHPLFWVLHPLDRKGLKSHRKVELKDRLAHAVLKFTTSNFNLTTLKHHKNFLISTHRPMGNKDNQPTIWSKVSDNIHWHSHKVTPKTFFKIL